MLKIDINTTTSNPLMNVSGMPRKSFTLSELALPPSLFIYCKENMIYVLLFDSQTNKGTPSRLDNLAFGLSPKLKGICCLNM